MTTVQLILVDLLIDMETRSSQGSQGILLYQGQLIKGVAVLLMIDFDFISKI